MAAAESTILIVDDSVEARAVLEGQLTRPEYRLLSAANGPEGLELAGRALPDLILLDVMMPGMDGLEVCRRLRADPALAFTPVILVTALEDRETRLLGLEAGADDFLAKPIDSAELQGRVRTILRINRYRRLLEEQAKFQQLVEHTTDGIALTDEAGLVIEWNPSQEHITGLSRAETLQRPAWEVLRTLSPNERAAADARENLAESMRQAAQTGHAGWAAPPVEIEIERRDGARRFVQAEVFAIRTGLGSRAGLVVRDISERVRAEAERKHADDERRHLLETLEQSVAERTRELSSLYQAASLAAAMRDLPSALPGALRLATAAVDCSAGLLYLLDPNPAAADLSTDEPAAAAPGQMQLAAQVGLPGAPSDGAGGAAPGANLAGWIVEHGAPLIVPDLTTDPRVPETDALHCFRFFAGAPLRRGSAAIGMLGVLGHGEEPFSLESLALLGSLADQISGMVERDRLERQAEAAATLQERQRLARDLHDSVTQSLYSFALLAEGARKDFQRGNLTRLEQTLAHVSVSAHQALKEMRLLLYQLRPPTLLRSGLPALLQHRLDSVERHARVDAHLNIEGDVLSLSPDWETELFRLAEEALNNALKHAQATEVRVGLWVTESRVELQVADNGLGFDATEAGSAGHGLSNMRERAAHLGGRLTITSARRSGTTVQAVFSKGR